jgi:protein deglycase
MKNVLLLLANGFEIYEASAFIDVIGWNLVDGDKSTKLFTCGLTKEVKSTFDQKIIVDFTIDQINPDEFAALAIPGGFEEYGFYRDAYSQEFSDLITKFEQRNKFIASICTGAFPVARSGILKGRPGTTYNLNPARHAALREMGVEVINEPIVVSRNVMTSWNPSTAMDVAFLLLEKLTSLENSMTIKSLMGFKN